VDAGLASIPTEPAAGDFLGAALALPFCRVGQNARRGQGFRAGCPPAHFLTARKLLNLLGLSPWRDWHGRCNTGLETIRNRKEITMLSWALTFLIIAIVAAVLGFGGIAGTAAGIAKILFVVFLVLFIISFIMGRRPKI
jgi:uncharacterized membrane protein YtjA (UPF0391 family)